ATGHKWNSGKITSTTSSKYTKTFTCTVCKKTEKKTYSKKANSLSKAKGKKVTVKYSSLRKKNQTVKKDSAFSLGGAQGKITFKKSSGSSKISVSSSGKITVKKGLKKGTYKVKVKISASGSDTYKAGSKTVSVTIVVK
ncbi:MAG: hypothetical protein IKR97_06930, partial [Eubacterium sp.]|nr:hypothetical protein [Eubacterium sp.]